MTPEVNLLRYNGDNFLLRTVQQGLERSSNLPLSIYFHLRIPYDLRIIDLLLSSLPRWQIARLSHRDYWSPTLLSRFHGQLPMLRSESVDPQKKCPMPGLLDLNSGSEMTLDLPWSNLTCSIMRISIPMSRRIFRKIFQ